MEKTTETYRREAREMMARIMARGIKRQGFAKVSERKSVYVGVVNVGSDLDSALSHRPVYLAAN